MHLISGKEALALFNSCRHWNEEQLKALKNWQKDGRMLVFTGAVDTEVASGVHAFQLPVTETVEGVTLPCIRFESRPGDVIVATADDGGVTEVLRRSPSYSVYMARSVLLSTDQLRKLVCAAGGQALRY